MNTEKQNTPGGEEQLYAEASHSWADPWTGEEVSKRYRFARPTKSQIKRLQQTAVKNSEAAGRNLILDTVHPDDKERLAADLEDYPALATTLSGWMVKACGLADLGN